MNYLIQKLVRKSGVYVIYILVVIGILEVLTPLSLQLVVDLLLQFLWDYWISFAELFHLNHFVPQPFILRIVLQQA